MGADGALEMEGLWRDVKFALRQLDWHGFGLHRARRRRGQQQLAVLSVAEGPHVGCEG
jgi:hypothetical protein